MTDYIAAVTQHGGITQAAKALGIPRTTLQDRYKKQRNQENIRESVTRLKQKAESPYIDIPNKVGKFTKILAIYDTHDEPKLSKDRFKWMGYHAKHAKYDHIVHGGDLADLESLCGHVDNDTYGGRLKGTVRDDLASLHDALALFQDHAGNIPVVGILGNHEQRAWDYENKNPEVFGIIQHALMSVLSVNNFDMKKYGDRVRIENIDFIHTPFQKGSSRRPMGGKTLMQRHMGRIIRPTVFGHNHMMGVYTEEKDDGEGGGLTMVNVPCSMPHGHIPDYVGKSPSGWSYGIVALTVMDGKIIGHRMISMLELQAEWESR